MLPKALLLFTLFFLLACSPTGKRPTDSKMYGFNVPVKKLVSKTYKKVAFADGKWVPADTASYSGCYINYYNKEGNLDSIIFMYLHPSGEKIIYTNICEYENGEKVWAKVYRLGYIDEIQKFKWTDKYSYTHAAVNYKNKPVFTIKIKLSELFNEEYGEIINYEEDGEIALHIKSKFIRDSNGCIIGKTDSNLLENMVSHYKYIHHKYDNKNTPIHSEEWLAGDSMPSKIYIKDVEYYE